MSSIAWTALLVLAPRASIAEDVRRPNFVLIVTDDHGADAGCYGTPGIKTPHMDGLARDGMLFRNAFSTCASCSPSRSALLTGMWPHANGHWRNTHAPRVDAPEEEFTLESSYRKREAVGVHEDIPTLVEILHRHGYETGITHKFHLSPPWKYRFKHRRKGDIGDAVTDMISACGDRPFFIQANVNETHRIWRTNQHERMELYPVDPDAIDIPGDMPDTDRMLREYRRYLYSVEAADHEIGHVLTALERSGKSEDTVVICTGDQGPAFQRGKATAYDRGVRVVMLIRGPGVSRGVETDALVSHVDVMPTILRCAGIEIPETVRGRPLQPLLTGSTTEAWRKYVFSEHNSHGPDLANEYYPTRGVHDGRMHYLRNLTPERRADRPIEEYASPRQGRTPIPWIVADCMPYGVYAGHTDCIQAAIAAKEEFPQPYAILERTIDRPPEELYDLESDPFETRNLIEDPRHNRKLNELRGALDRWMEETGDPGAALKDVPRRRNPLSTAERPNIILMLADDLGWSDTTLFGTTSLYETPNIERLAARGMTFTRAYAASPLCSPTRASVLTGLSPARTGITAPVCHTPRETLEATVSASGPPSRKSTIPQSVSRLATRYYTLAEMLKDNGYATGHFGKWHLGPEPYSPLEHGFDVDIPHHPGPGPAGSYVAPWKFKDFDHDPDVPDQHIEDRMAKEAVAFLEKHKKEPFFVNYWMFSVHAPFDAKKALIEKYRKRVKQENPQRSPTYAAMIESMDDAVGTLLDALDRLGLADDTIIVFASDNGGNMYNEVDGTTPTDNAPLRGGKATMYEGGVRGPAIVAYPGRVKAGSRSDEVIQSCDFYPTLLELLGVQPQPGQTFDGISIVPALRGERLRREAIFTYFPHSPGVPDWLPPSVSVHSGDWKLIRIFFGGENGRHRWKLFNLRDDLGEQHDLADKFPARVRELDAKIEAFLVDTKAVVPLPNAEFDPAKYRPELEGKGRLQGGAQKTEKKRPAAGRAKPVAGWQAAGTCKLSVEKGSLVVHSDGGDPHFSYRLPEAISATTLVLHFTMASDSSGEGRIFWQEQGAVPAFFRGRSRPFDVNHDGEPHDYAITWSPSKPVPAIRIDPSSGPGTMRLSSIQLTDDTGAVLHQWRF